MAECLIITPVKLDDSMLMTSDSSSALRTKPFIEPWMEDHVDAFRTPSIVPCKPLSTEMYVPIAERGGGVSHWGVTETKRHLMRLEMNEKPETRASKGDSSQSGHDSEHN